MIFKSIVSYFDIEIQQSSFNTLEYCFITTYMYISHSMYLNMKYYCIKDKINVTLFLSLNTTMFPKHIVLYHSQI